MRRQLNLKFVALFLTILIVLGGVVHFLHGFQVRRNASALLQRAQKMEADKDFAKALDYLSRYLGFHPDDTDALARYGLLLAQEAKTSPARLRAFFVLDQVLRLDPSRDDVRQRAVSVAMTLERFADARDNLEVLLEAAPNDPELAELRGRCEEACSQFVKAAEWYEKALQHAPQRIDCSVRLARVYRRRLDKPSQADDVMDRLVNAYPDSVQARLARGAYLRDLGLLDAADQEIGYARDRLAPDEADVLLSSADLAQVKGKQAEARGYFERGLKLHPDDSRFYFGLASLELRAGQHAEAVKHLQQALKVLPDRAEVVWTAADLFLDAGEPKEAKKLLARLSNAEWHPAVNYLRGRLLLIEGKFAEARTLLEKQRQGLARYPELLRQTDLFLGVCYERLGNPDQQLAAYKRAATGASPNLAARQALASALLANGQIDEALTEYQRLMPSVPETRLVVARLLLLRTLRLPAGRRNWDEVEALLKEAPAPLRDTVEYHVLGVEMLLVRNKIEEARQDLRTACQKTPKEVRYWLSLASLMDREKTADGEKPFARSFQVLDEAEKALGDVVELRLARARRLAQLPVEQARPALRQLEENVGRFREAEQINLLVGLADAHERLGDRENARRLLGQAAPRRPQDLGIRQRLFFQALAGEDDAACKALLAEIRKMEGEEGSLWRFAEAARLLALAHKGDRSGLAQARRRLTEVARSRPTWSQALLLNAEIDDLEGNLDAALETYQRALDRGAQTPRVVYRTVQLLISRRRIEEAKQTLDRLQEHVTTSADLSRLATQVSLLNQDSREHVMELADKAAVKDSKDYRDQLFRGQVLWSVDKPREAEEAFRQAVALDATAPEAWVALVVFLAGTEQKQQAEAETDKARRALPADKAPLALAACYEAIGQKDKAEEQHLSLLKGQPNDPAALRGLASFYLRAGEVKKAESHLRQLILAPARGGEEGPRWARRNLAIALAANNDFRELRQALALIDENLRERQESPEDQRARALLLALQPGGRRESIRTLESAYARQRPTLGEQLLLAQLYEANRDWPKANEQLLALLNSKGGDAAVYLAYYVRALLRQDKLPEAILWLERLKKKEPESASTVELTARVLAKQGHGEEATPLVGQLVRKEFAAKKDPNILAAGAGLLEELNQTAAAEKLYRQYVTEAEPKTPECVLRLAMFLARQKRLPEALDLCERAGQKCQPEMVASVYANSLRVGQPKEQDFQRVERWLDRAIKQNPRSEVLLLVLANVRDAQNKIADSKAIYRSILDHNPNNLVALNNLAWLLAMHAGQKKEALELLNKAMESNGPVATLLDTRGMVHLTTGQTDLAIKDLEEAVAERQRASLYFHLTQAYLQAKNRTDAERAWHRAKELKLSEKDLESLEIPAYREMLALLG